MLKEIISDVAVETSEKMYAFGLPRHQFYDSMHLAEHVFALDFRNRIMAAKVEGLVPYFTFKQNEKLVGYFKRKIRSYKMSLIKREIVKKYQQELQIRLQLSRTTASLLADLVMPKIIDKMGEAILKNQWSEAAFIDLINQTLPTYSAIGTSLKENRYK